MLFVALAIIFISIQTEAVVTAYLVTTRGGLLFGALIALFLALSSVKLRSL